MEPIGIHVDTVCPSGSCRYECSNFREKIFHTKDFTKNVLYDYILYLGCIAHPVYSCAQYFVNYLPHIKKAPQNRGALQGGINFYPWNRLFVDNYNGVLF